MRITFSNTLVQTMAIFLFFSFAAWGAGDSWVCEVFPPEREVVYDEDSGAKVVFITTAESEDTNFYFHQRSFLPDSSVLFFRRGTDKGWQMFGHLEKTGELFRVQRPDHVLQVEPTAARYENSVYVVHDDLLCEWSVSVHANQAKEMDPRIEIQERQIGRIPADVKSLNGLSETSDGKAVVIGYRRDQSPRSRIVRIDRQSGEISEIMAIDDTIYHIQASWETPDLVLFSRVYLDSRDRATEDHPDFAYSRLHLADLSDCEPWPVYPQEMGELATHENWWVDDQITFFAGKRKEGNAEEAHMKVIDTKDKATRILGSGAWWPGGAPSEVAKQNWWHGSGSPDGRFAAADNWHGDIGIFSGKTSRTRILTTGHRIYGGGTHPHVGWDPTATKVVFASNRNGNADVCIGYLPQEWIDVEW